jgi:hypothetical protein
VDLSKAVPSKNWWPNASAVLKAIHSLPSKGDPVAVVNAIQSKTWPPADYPKVRCFVHMTRKPVDMVVSAYLYHLRLTKRLCSAHELCEAWLYEPTSKCNSLPGVSLFDKLNFAPNETAGLLCQLENSRGTILQMKLMEREVRRRPDVGTSFDLAEWRDSGTALHKMLSFCGMDDLAEPTLRAYDKAYAKQLATAHFNHDDDRAERLREYLYQIGVAEWFPDVT